MADTITPKDLEGLPAELQSELKVSEADQSMFKTIEAIAQCAPDPTSFGIDRAMICMFRYTGNVVQRTTMQNRLSRMAKRNLIVAHGNGVYGLRDEDIPGGGHKDEAAE